MNIAILGAAPGARRSPSACRTGIASRCGRAMRRKSRQCPSGAAISATCRKFRCLPKLQLTAAMEVALADAALILVCVPVAGLRGTLQKIAQLPTPGPVIWACKGFEANSAQLPHQIAAEILPGQLSCGVLSGPGFAEELPRIADRIDTGVRRRRIRAADCAGSASCPVAHLLKHGRDRGRGGRCDQECAGHRRRYRGWHGFRAQRKGGIDLARPGRDDTAGHQTGRAAPRLCTVCPARAT